MALLRKQFTEVAVRAAKRWTFTPPTTGADARNESWLVRVPVEFVMQGDGPEAASAGQWDSYVPGPRNTDMPWAREKLLIAGDPDALPDGGIYPLRQGAMLLTPPAT